MKTIYEPKGKAREYSPLALNLYEGCDHNCFYCYVPQIKQRYNRFYKHEKVECRNNVIQNLEQNAKKTKNKNQVLLSFTGDPYCKANEEHKLTRKALEILYRHKIPVAILTKGGMRSIKDFDIISKFKKHIKIGATLTFDNDTDSIKNEPGAATFSERKRMLKYFHEKGVITWVSIEPVLDPEQSLNCIKETMEYVSHYKIGKLNHYPEIENKINWTKFLNKSVKLMRKNNKQFYIKKDLLKWNKNTILKDEETDMDFLNTKPFNEKNELFI